ncbi:single-stranded DNA-binding protein [Acidimicrobiia bacterium EGI L10123]|jgi:single-strand DNA-binding protein|uniref:single-stranded DNA-binding protein n=1 Tax=Salinilacustrithrix flava TaxID=2957203 RepID=UPI000E9082A0|nr:single-stranded DNA-binding protein [Acidimicrobiia bacterium EGI L10123]HAS12419.1 single-stranded DNA-binding protein [Acidimicrobiaceae bacterium]
MANGNTITIIGNVTRDPELRYLTSGTALAQLGVAVNRRYMQNNEWQEETSFFDVVCWRDLADNVSESISKGDRIIVTGRLEQRSWETQDGDKRSKVEIVADEVGPSLRWATARIEKIRRDGPAGGSTGGGGGGGNYEPPRDEPKSYDDAEEPF